MKYVIYFNGAEELHNGEEYYAVSPDLEAAKRYINKCVPLADDADGGLSAWKGSAYPLADGQSVPDLAHCAYVKDLHSKEEMDKKDANYYASVQLHIRTHARVFERKTNLTQAQVDEREPAYLKELSEEQKAQYTRGKALFAAGYRVA